MAAVEPPALPPGAFFLAGRRTSMVDSGTLPYSGYADLTDSPAETIGPSHRRDLWTATDTATGEKATGRAPAEAMIGLIMLQQAHPPGRRSLWPWLTRRP